MHNIPRSNEAIRKVGRRCCISMQKKNPEQSHDLTSIFIECVCVCIRGYSDSTSKFALLVLMNNRNGYLRPYNPYHYDFGGDKKLTLQLSKFIVTTVPKPIIRIIFVVLFLVTGNKRSLSQIESSASYSECYVHCLRAHTHMTHRVVVLFYDFKWKF